MQVQVGRPDLAGDHGVTPVADTVATFEAQHGLRLFAAENTCECWRFSTSVSAVPTVPPTCPPAGAPTSARPPAALVMGLHPAGQAAKSKNMI